MTMIKITPENMNDFPIGTVVLSRYGAYYPEVEGVVVGYEVKPATKFFPISASLIVKQEDGVKQFVSQVYALDAKVGPIGTYLLKVAEKTFAKTTKSPWAIAE